MAGSLLLLLVVGSPVRAATPSQTCRANKNRIAGKYADCLEKAEAKYAVGADDALRAEALQKCATIYNLKWAVAEGKAAGACASSGDQGPVRDAIDDCIANVAISLAGGTLVDYPAELAACQANNTVCETTLATCSAERASCAGDVSTCGVNLAACQASLAVETACGNGTIEANEVCDQGSLGNHTCVTEGFAAGVLACGPGCQLDTSGCFVARYLDNLDGTITDRKTGLQWEHKVGNPNDLHACPLWAPCPDPHAAGNTYNWCADLDSNAICDSATAPPNGSVYVDFLAKLNGSEDGNCFANRCDWRLPTKNELLSLVVPGCTSAPCLDPLFATTGYNYHWSGTTLSSAPGAAEAVGYGVPVSGGGISKVAYLQAIAVRTVQQ